MTLVLLGSIKSILRQELLLLPSHMAETQCINLKVFLEEAEGSKSQL